MDYEIPEPDISPDFTLEDIRKIRDWHYEKRKNMTPEEESEDIRKGAKKFLELLKKPIDPAIREEANRRLEHACSKNK